MGVKSLMTPSLERVSESFWSDRLNKLIDNLAKVDRYLNNQKNWDRDIG